MATPISRRAVLAAGIPGSLLTLYDSVVWDGHQFPGHWSRLYAGRNGPSTDGTHIWQWMAEQRG